MDDVTRRELYLYIINDGDMYRRSVTPTLALLRRKFEGRVYDDRKAMRQWLHVAKEGARRYCLEHCSPGDRWYTVFPMDVRRDVAEDLADYYADQILDAAVKDWLDSANEQ